MENYLNVKRHVRDADDICHTLFYVSTGCRFATSVVMLNLVSFCQRGVLKNGTCDTPSSITVLLVENDLLGMYYALINTLT